MLHNLIDYADTHEISGNEGFASKRIRYFFSFTPEGKYLKIFELDNKGENFTGVPHIQFTGDVPTRQFLVDTIEYLILFSSEADSFRKASLKLCKDLKQEKEFPSVKQLLDECIDLLDEGNYAEFCHIGYKTKWQNLIEDNNLLKNEIVSSFLSNSGPLNKFYEGDDIQLVLTLNELITSANKLLKSLTGEDDFAEIQKVTVEMLQRLENEQFLELREQKTKESWLKLLKKKKRGKRQDIKEFTGAKGPVNRLFSNSRFKQISKHQFCLRLLMEAAEEVPVFQHLVSAITNPSVRKQMIKDLYDRSTAPVNSNNASFAIYASAELKMLVQQNSWHNWWKTKLPALTQNKSPHYARCFLSGEIVNPVMTHPKIKGLGGVGGTIETSLVSFDKGSSSFQSYGFRQGENAAISAKMAVKYTSSINYLLSRQHQLLAGAKIVYWYSSEVESNEDLLKMGFEGRPAWENEEEVDETLLEAQANQKAKKFLKSVRNGEIHRLKEARYFALTLQGNQGRAVVQNWMDGSFSELASSFDEWFTDLEIPRISGKGTAKLPKFETLITCLLKERKKNQNIGEWIKPVTGFRDALWRAALGGPKILIPENAARLALLRLRESTLTKEWENTIAKEGEKTGMRRARLYARIGLIKAYLRRNINEGVDMENPDKNDNSVYLVGRFFALLADLQRTAHKRDGGNEVKSTIVDRYYSTASTCPMLVLGRLVDLSNHHLRKLSSKSNQRDQNTAKAIEKEMANIGQRIDYNAIPDILPLADQSRFALGYYQQIAIMNQRKAEMAAKKSEKSTMEQSDD